MDLYLFRGKEILTGEWLYGLIAGGISKRDGREMIKMYHGWRVNLVWRDTVGQYINQDDAEGEKLFEGDIIGYLTQSGFATDKKDGKAVMIKYQNGGFFPFSVAGWEVTPAPHEIKKLGNIHDNPELMEV